MFKTKYISLTIPSIFVIMQELTWEGGHRQTMDADSSEDDTANYNNNNKCIYMAYLRHENWRRYAFLRIFRFLS